MYALSRNIKPSHMVIGHFFPFRKQYSVKHQMMNDQKVVFSEHNNNASIVLNVQEKIISKLVKKSLPTCRNCYVLLFWYSFRNDASLNSRAIIPFENFIIVSINSFNEKFGWSEILQSNSSNKKLPISTLFVQ